MAYEIKYQASFDNSAQQTYTVQILELDYVGSVLPLSFSGVPIKHAWQTDEPKPAIKGSSVMLTIHNPGDLPITDFYSNTDDQFKIRVFHGAQLKFEGFLVQDDCSELMVDFVHEIALSFNDNLGLLKDVALDVNLERLPLLDIIKVCILNTGLELDLFVYANIFEASHSTADSFLPQTIIDTQTFLKSESFDNCYSVLETLLNRFHLTLLQADGHWNIVRWDEVRYYPTAIDVPYFHYDSAFTLIGTGVMDANIVSGFMEATYPETGLTRSIFRPFKFVKETFNYVQPKYLLRNYDLQDLGAFITSYVDGANTNYEYEFTDWDPGGFSPAVTYYIRVVRDTATDEEIERYVVIEGATGDTARSIVGQPFEVGEGDRITFEYTFRTTASQAGPATIILALRLFDGTTTRFADDDPTVNWKPGVGWNFLIPSGGNTNENQSVTINPGRIPFSGLIYCYLPQAVDPAGPGDETRIKDIRVTYTPYINDSTKIIGHIHRAEQVYTIKNNEESEIFMDDSPRNSVIGTLFRSTFTGVLQDRTTTWYRLTVPAGEKRIGEIMTYEQDLWRQKPRTKLEGTFYGIGAITMLAVLSNTAVVNGIHAVYFLFGSLEIDYKNNSLNCTLWEIYEDEEEEDLSSPINYTFKYIYDTK